MKTKLVFETFILSVSLYLIRPFLCKDTIPKHRGLINDENCANTNNYMVWSKLLEEYAVGGPEYKPRGGKVFGPTGTMNSVPTQLGEQMYHRYIPMNNMYISKRIGEVMELEPHMRPPAKVINPIHRPGVLSSSYSSIIQQQLSHQSLPQMHQQQQPQPPQQQHIRAVSENDLYLLGAMEKLVYRVDYLESRLHRAEQLIYYLMAGNHQKEVRDPCPANFTRISDDCYYINSDQQVNWKTANSACKSLNSYLAEFEKVSENEELIAYLLNQQTHRGRDFWLGGLNPGLLWIWANSAKPVNPNMNLTSIANNLQKETNNSSAVNATKIDPDQILNNTMEIKGQGRCLRLSYNPSKHSYFYYGQECTSRHHYICEHEDKTLDNKIRKITRELQIS